MTNLNKNNEIDFDIFAFQPSLDKFEVKKGEFEPKKFKNKREKLYYIVLLCDLLTMGCLY